MLQRLRDRALLCIEPGVLARELLGILSAAGQSFDERSGTERDEQSEQSETPPEAGEKRPAELRPGTHDHQ